MKIMSWPTAVLPVLNATSYSVKYSQKQITPTLLFKRIYNRDIDIEVKKYDSFKLYSYFVISFLKIKYTFWNNLGLGKISQVMQTYKLGSGSCLLKGDNKNTCFLTVILTFSFYFEDIKNDSTHATVYCIL